jgi:GTP-binding protein LepA
VDFSYEVTASLAASEGALLIVDASQGVEAQTLANAYLAVENNLEIVPVINKIDLPARSPTKPSGRSRTSSGSTRATRSSRARRKGTGVHEILEAIVPPAAVAEGGSRRAAEGADLRLLVRPLPRRHHPDARDRRRRPRRHEDQVHAAGAGVPGRAGRDLLAQADAGRRARRRRGRVRLRGIKTVSDAKIGDTITEAAVPPSSRSRLQGNEADGLRGLYPVEGSEYPQLRDALEKLRLNDASFHFEPETSLALGFGFRCGFLGLLHMEIVQERLGARVRRRPDHRRRRACSTA